MKVDFYHYNFHEIIQWENIWKACVRRGIDAQLVIEPPNLNTYGMPQHVFEHIINYCRERDYPYLLKGRYDEADAAIVTQSFEWLYRYKGLKIRCHYGAGVIKNHCWIKYEAICGFDGFLIAGEFDKQRLIRNGIEADKLWVMGYPKLLPLYHQTISRPSLASRFKLDVTKKTIVYLPTHHVNSSIDMFTEAIGTLRHDYNLIIKPHHHNLDKEFGRLNRLKSTGAIVIDYPCSIVDVLAIADLAICDVRSGSFTESIMANVPTIGLILGDGGHLDTLEPIAYLLAPICNEAAQLPELVQASIRKYPELNTMVQDFTKPYLFGYCAGKDDDVAVDGIVHLVRSKQRPSAAPPSQKPDALVSADAVTAELVDLAKVHGGKHILEIRPSGDGSRTRAIIDGIRQNPCDTPKLFCIEPAREKHATLCNEFNRYDFVKIYNALPVDLNNYPAIEDILLFYQTVKPAHEEYNPESVNAAYLAEQDNINNRILLNGIEHIKTQHKIEHFDIALIGDSGFTGTTELDAVYGARYLVLDNVFGYTNYFNYRRLKFDKYYVLCKESLKKENSYAIFKYQDRFAYRDN